MSKLIHLCDGLSLPLDIITMRIAVYGDSGAGKTTFARLLAEKIHDANHRFCAVDLKNDWFGLKSSADGQSAGLPVVIFGGPRADVRLIPDGAAAAALATTIASIDQSVILDLDGLSRTKQEKFLAPFLDGLYEANRRPLLLFCDEADRYAPQKPMSQEALMSLSSSEDIARRGRKRGIGSFWLTQRTAVLNKNVSEFANLTVVFRTPGEKDLRELEDRVGRIAGKETVKEVMRLAPGLADGEAVFLSAHPKLRRHMPDPVRPIQLPMPATFDSSATPSVGQRRREPKVLATTDLKAIEQKMAAQVQQARDDDPRLLRAELAKAKAELAKLKQAPVPKPETKTKTVERLVLKDGQLDRLDKMLQKVMTATTRASEVVAATKAIGDGIAAAVRSTAAGPVAAPVIHRPSPVLSRPAAAVAATAPARRTVTAPPESNGDGGEISVGAGALHRILVALAQNHPKPVDDRKLAVLTNVQRGGSTMRGALADGRKAGWIDGGKDSLRITPEGLTALGDYTPLPTGAELRAYWQRELGTGAARKIFDVLLSVYPDSIDRAALAEQVGVEDGGSTMRGALSDLRSLELCQRGGLRASDELFTE